MGNPAQVVLSIAGAAIGFVASGGNPLGAAWGCRLDRLPAAAAFPCAAVSERAAPPGAAKEVSSQPAGSLRAL